jgi:hypothetical protein
MTKKHKVFISYHHANDEKYKQKFERMFANHYDILVSKAVQIGDIDPTLKVDTIRQKIRDEYLRDSTVTVVLIGKDTWRRKHIDWEIGASIRKTSYNSRSGLIGIFLPTHSDYDKEKFNPYIIPPRLYDNHICKFAKLYDWSDNPRDVQQWIHDAFEQRNRINPDNAFPNFKNNRKGEQWQK